MIHAVIMAGGGGTRFWPRSRKRCPKQFLKLFGDRSLLQQALERIEAVVPPQRTWVITGADQCELVIGQLPHLPAERIVAEPCGRDTAACLGVGAALIAREDADAVMVCMPSDHVIEPAQEFRRAVQAATHFAADRPQALITIGIPPEYPATGYGYIHRGAALPPRMGVAAFQIQSFKEKPDARAAEGYLRSGEYYWNSGIFVWRAATLLAELERRQQTLFAAVSRIAQAWATPQQGAVFRREFEPLPRISIDYAVMEGCRDGIVLHAPFRWDDVGSWGAIERFNPQDAAGNTVLAEHCGVDTRGCLIVGDRDRLIATVGVSDLIIVQDGDALLVADKRNEAAVKQLVDQLKSTGREKFL